jgi:hypothetical protein
MAWYWSWVLVLGAVTMVGGALASRLSRGSGETRSPVAVSRLLIGVLLAVIAFVLCLPGRFPFSTGQQLGYGVLLGLAAAVLAVIVVRVARPSDDYAARVAAAAAAGGAAIIWVAITEMIFHGDPSYALLGGLAGGLLTVLPMAWEREEIELKAFGSALLLTGLGSLLAIARYELAPQRAFWPLPTMPLASGMLGAVVGALLLGRGRSARWGTVLLVIAVEAAACLGSRALLQRHDHITLTPQFTYLLVLGWAAFLLIALISGPAERRPFSVVAPGLLAVTMLIIAFNIAGGYGAALVVAAGLPVAVALRRENGGAPLWAIALGILFLAYRLYLANFEESFRGAMTLEFGRHYVFVGLAAGLLWIGATLRSAYSAEVAEATSATKAGSEAPSLRSTSSARLTRRSSGGLAAQLAGLALLPAVLFMVFGYEGLLGLVLGLWIAQFVLPAWTPGEWDWPALPSSFLPLATIWALIMPNWAEFMLDQPRWVRGVIVGAAAAAVLLVLGLMRQRAPGPPSQAASAAEG